MGTHPVPAARPAGPPRQSLAGRQNPGIAALGEPPARRPGKRPPSPAARAAALRRRRRRFFPLLAALLLLSTYLYLDIRDIAPGVLTTDEGWPDAEPFPEVSLPARPAAEPDLLAPAPAQGAPIPNPLALGSITDALLDDDRVGPAPSVMVIDVLSGDVLLDEGGQLGRAPASVLKILTGVAALQVMGGEHRFVTRVIDDGEGRVVLVGGGDIALAAQDGDPSSVRGHAGLADLADQVAPALLERGQQEVTLYVDDTLFTGPLLAPNWDSVDVAGGWAMPIMPIAVNLGRQQGVTVRQSDPALHAAETFAERLEERGVTVREVDRGVATGDDVLGEVASAPLSQIVEYNLHYSDNPLAEVLGRMTAHATGAETSFSGAGQAVLDVLADLGVNTDGVHLVETSGLSSLSRVNAVVLTETLLVAAGTPHLADVIRGLPVGGLEGTLENRMNGTGAAGLIHAKTGTLPRVVSLAGLAHTGDGRLLAFAVLTGDFEAGGGFLARLAIDDWATRIADCGCS